MALACCLEALPLGGAGDEGNGCTPAKRGCVLAHPANLEPDWLCVQAIECRRACTGASVQDAGPALPPGLGNLLLRCRARAHVFACTQRRVLLCPLSSPDLAREPRYASDTAQRPPNRVAMASEHWGMPLAAIRSPPRCDERANVSVGPRPGGGGPANASNPERFLSLINFQRPHLP
jgi:hypothetical protein